MKPTKSLSEPKNYLILALFYTVCISIAFLIPGGSIKADVNLPLDKIAHIFIHAVLLFLWLLYVVPVFKEKKTWILIVLVLTLCVSYGIIIEVLQSVVTTSRKADIIDVVANVLGSFLGLILYIKLK